MNSMIFSLSPTRGLNAAWTQHGIVVDISRIRRDVLHEEWMLLDLIPGPHSIVDPGEWTDHEWSWQNMTDLFGFEFRSIQIWVYPEKQKRYIVFNHDSSWQPSLADRQEMTITSTSAIHFSTSKISKWKFVNEKSLHFGLWKNLVDLDGFFTVSCTDPAHLRPTCCRHRQRKRVGQGSSYRWQRSLPPWR